MGAIPHPLGEPAWIARVSGWRDGRWLETRLKALSAVTLLVVAVVLCALARPALAEPDYPAFTGRVVDAAHVLSEPDRAALTRKLADLRTRTNVQFAVATVPSLGDLEIEPYANALFRKWGIGQKGANNGLLLLLAPNERKVRFEVGYGLEGTLTDAQSKLILHNDMVPKLKAGDPGGALKAGVDDAIQVLTGKGAALPRGTSQPSASRDDTSGPWVFGFLFGAFPLFFVVVFVAAIIQTIRRGARWASGTGSSMSSSDSSFGSSSSDSSSSSSSSDSFSGGGGGDSGGGGASDSY